MVLESVEMFADDVAHVLVGRGPGQRVAGLRPATLGMLDSGDTPSISS